MDTSFSPPERRTIQHVSVLLADGGTVALRPLQAGELDVLDIVFAGMSAQSRLRRYLVPMPRLPGAVRRPLANVDGRRHVAWVASVMNRPVGLCRFIRVGEHTAEVAFEVVDAEQRRGIGAALIDAVTTVAHHHGIRWVTATLAPDNAASVRMLDRMGIELTMTGGLLEGHGPLRLTHPSLVDRRAVMALIDQAR